MKWGRQIEVETSVLSEVNADLSTLPVSLVTKWKHHLDLEFADSDYGTPAQVDILLGGKVFNRAVLQGRRFGPSRAPSAFKTCLGWVLNEEVKSKGWQCLTHI